VAFHCHSQPRVRGEVRDIFSQAQQVAADSYEGERGELYRGLKLEGILEAPQNLCIACDPVSERGHRLGRQSMPETAIYSAVCAVQNLWLAARAEGIGVGWVSILDPEALKVCSAFPPTWCWSRIYASAMSMAFNPDRNWSGWAGNNAFLWQT
jgi:5,6-dimethylbenzimidazole synthase